MKKKRSAGSKPQVPTVSSLLTGADSPAGGRSRSWFMLLGEEQQALCIDVRNACHADTTLNRTQVAKNMIEQLGLQVKPDAVRKWLMLEG